MAKLMRYLGSRYVQYVNFAYRRRGTLWEGRFKSSMVDAESYLLRCYRYIESNPVRASMVKRPEDYRWSSYGAHALGRTDGLIRDHALYEALGKTEQERQEAYRALFRSALDRNALAEIRGALNKGLALGRERFKDEVEAALARSVRPAKPGRRKAQITSGL